MRLKLLKPIKFQLIPLSLQQLWRPTANQGRIKTFLVPLVKMVNHFLIFLKVLCYCGFVKKRHYSRRLEKAERVLILAPHMDDEVIGCGGMIRQVSQAGNKVSCIYFTDGAFGLAGSQRDEIYRTRLLETKASAALLGMQQLYFLEEPDGCLYSGGLPMDDQLLKIIQQEDPDQIFIPYPLDFHPDHKSVVLVLSRVAARMQTVRFSLFMYQIQVPMTLEDITEVIDISDVFETKQKAMAAFESQTRVPFRVISHLQSCQRWLIGFKPRAVEVFARLPLNEMPQMVRKMRISGVQIKRYAEVGAHAVRRKQWT